LRLDGEKVFLPNRDPKLSMLQIFDQRSTDLLSERQSPLPVSFAGTDQRPPFGPARPHLTIQPQKIPIQAKVKSVYKRSGLFKSLLGSK
jgi:hypothetical protein